MAARLGLPRNMIKKLLNHISGLDSTNGYIVLHPEHRREPMNQITVPVAVMSFFLTDWTCSNKSFARTPCSDIVKDVDLSVRFLNASTAK